MPAASPSVTRDAHAAALAHVFDGAPPPQSPFDRNTPRHRVWQMAANRAQAEAQRFARQFPGISLSVSLKEHAR